MKAVWEPKAIEAKRQVAAYIRKEFGIKRAKLFRQEIDDTVSALLRTPNIGRIDPLFINRGKTYRSVIINGLNKLVYYIENDTLNIAAFWDTRREPKNQARQTK
ncbi:MAG: type II toxin-antitoxin system RelE/ParE family toxin [Prevotella sp.]|nr:type II toxin-antitoxin system RelE/ParE family toxin [Prevotella sp.]